MLPFFVAALAVAPPARPLLHGGAIALVAAGAALAAFGRAFVGGAANPVAAAGAALYVVGMAAVGLSAALPLRRAAGARRPATELAYAVGLVNVAVGASLAGLYVAGWPAVVAGWPGLRVAHAWLNAFGFVGLVVAGTLIHFAPTVFGSRIRRRRAGWLAVAALAAGPPLVALGHALTDDTLVARRRAHRRPRRRRPRRPRRPGVSRPCGLDDAIRRGTASPPGRCSLAPAWLLVALLLAATRALPGGADPAAWRLDDVLAPLVAGFVVQVLLGALAHLVPAIGPGSPERHAAERRTLGREATLRLIAWNAGTGAAHARPGGRLGSPRRGGCGAPGDDARRRAAAPRAMRPRAWVSRGPRRSARSRSGRSATGRSSCTRCTWRR